MVEGVVGGDERLGDGRGGLEVEVLGDLRGIRPGTTTNSAEARRPPRP